MLLINILGQLQMAVRSMFVLTNYNGTFYSQMQRTKDILLCLPKTVVTNKVYHLDVITIISSNTVELPSLSFIIVEL